MVPKISLILLVLVYGGASHLASEVSKPITKDFEYGGSTYHINSAGFYDRMLALEYCNDYLDMRMVDFDKGSAEFLAVVDNIITNGLNFHLKFPIYGTDPIELFPNPVGYWTSGLKNPAHDNQWFWETTEEFITEFHWGAGQPHNSPDQTFLCIYFSLDLGGWVDEDCFKVRLDIGVICEKKQV